MGRVLATVSPMGNGLYGPDFCLISCNDPDVMRQMVVATQKMAFEFIQGASSINTGKLHATEWWLKDCELEVQWLRAESILNEDGDEPQWLHESGYGSPSDDWAPGLFEAPDPARPFEKVELETLNINSDGMIRIKGCVKNTSCWFMTYEFPVGLLSGESADMTLLMSLQPALKAIQGKGKKASVIKMLMFRLYKEATTIGELDLLTDADPELC